MLSQEGEEALARLAEGQIMNPVHTIARELITAGLAVNDWGHLALTEAGRVRARRRHGGTPLEIIDEHVCDMSQYINPMGMGPEVARTAPPPEGVWVKADFETAHAEIEKAARPEPNTATLLPEGTVVNHTTPLAPRQAMPEGINREPKPWWNNPIEPATDDYTRALRAAGIATGVTGLNVDVKWVHAFMDAFNAQ